MAVHLARRPKQNPPPPWVAFLADLATTRPVESAASALSLLTLLWGLLGVFADAGGGVAAPILVALGAALLGVAFVGAKAPPRDVLFVGGACLVSGLLLYVLPPYVYGWQFNGIFHRTFFEVPLLLGLGVPAVCCSLYYLLGATPRAQDYSRYPLVLLPIVLLGLFYLLLLWPIVTRGLPGLLQLDVLFSAYQETTQNAKRVGIPGMWNQITGTLFLIMLTAAIALPTGTGIGVLVTQYPGRLASAVSTATTLLRVLSVYIIGVGAFTLVRSASHWDPGTLASDLLRGVTQGDDGGFIATKGSFFLAALFLSVLAIPVVARSAEEGLKSVPPGIREGSIALGATDGRTLLRLLLPWAAPNILTGLLLGCAEAAGSAEVLLFIAGDGHNGVGLTSNVTSLPYLMLYATYGPKQFVEAMLPYRFTAGLLLLGLTLGMTVLALVLRRKLGKHRQGA